MIRTIYCMQSFLFWRLNKSQDALTVLIVSGAPQWPLFWLYMAFSPHNGVSKYPEQSKVAHIQRLSFNIYPLLGQRWYAWYVATFTH